MTAATPFFHITTQNGGCIMRDFNIDLIWTKVQIAITAIGGWIGYFVGGMDGMLIALIVLMSLDYISGIMCAVIDKKLSSAIGIRGICSLLFGQLFGLSLVLVGQRGILSHYIHGQHSYACYKHIFDIVHTHDKELLFLIKNMYTANPAILALEQEGIDQ
jgi:hypothetical protein